MQKVKTIILKEWAEVFKNRLVLFTVAFMPLILTALPIVTLVATGGLGDELSSSVSNAPPDEFFGELCSGLSEMDCVQVYTLNLFAMMFMLLPVVIPVTIAAYSVVGEKMSRSLEPLLATPITTLELLAGKGIAAFVPAVAATWLSFGLYVLAAWLVVNEQVFSYVLDPMWLLAIFVVGPLLTIAAVSTAIIISSRVTDPRVAEQLSAVVVVPIIMMMLGQSVGYIILDKQLIVILGLAVAVLDVILVYVSVHLFQRDNILTKWK